MASRLENVISLTKRRGFVYPCGEIYGGTRSAWDYGPLGVELKENVKRQWWRAMVTRREDVVGLDSSVILPRQVWEASGHVNAFVDPLVAIPAMAAATERIGFVTNVLKTPLRHPLLVAKSVGSTAAMFPGRITLGILIFQDLWAILILALQPHFTNPRLLLVVMALSKSLVLLAIGYLLRLRRNDYLEL